MRRAEHTNPNFLPLEKIGEGGMGVVYKARDVRLEREIALKELKPEQSDDRDLLRRFLQEARTTSQLQHPGIPPVYEVGNNEDGTPFIALKLVEGDTLATVLQRLKDGDPDTHAEYTFERRIQIVQRLCETLDYAHNHGFIHRDLKPENVMLGRYGEVFVMDWGVAKFIGQANPGVLRQNYSETKSGVFTGTPLYASPEQLSGQEHLGPGSDQYSIGVLLYEFMTLCRPHEHVDVKELISQVLTRPPREPESLEHATQGRVPREVSQMIMRALDKEPERRYPDVKALSNDLQLFLQNQSRPASLEVEPRPGPSPLSRLVEKHPALVYGWLCLPIVLLLMMLLRN